MKEKIERLANGEFQFTVPSIQVSVEKLELTAGAEKYIEGKFYITNSESSQVKGIIYTAGDFIAIHKNQFSGIENEITYQISFEYLQTGETKTGEIQIISDCGEIEIPVLIQSENPFCMTSLGKMKDLFHFANLAKQDWLEAAKLFKSEQFKEIFLSHDQKEQIIYDALLKENSTSQALEEFLTAAKKKNPVIITAERTEFEYQISTESVMDRVILTKNTWGYFEMKLTSDADFLALEHKYLWSENFIGSSYPLEFILLPEKMYEGKNYGHIILSTITQQIVLTIECQCIRERKNREENRQERKKAEYQIEQNYLEFRMGSLKLDEYVKETENLIIKLYDLGYKEKYQWMYIHLMIASGRRELAGELLEQKKDSIDRTYGELTEEYCKYLYLNALYQKDDNVTDYAIEQLQLYYKQTSCFSTLWCLFYLDTEYEDNLKLKINSLKEQYSRGIHSPVLYYECMMAYNLQPSILQELGSFEIQVIWFGIKHNKVGKEAILQFAYLAGKEKKLSVCIYRCLVKIYNRYKSKEILSSLVSLLIKNHKTSYRHLEWYRLGVESQLKITELYEYYMYTVPENSYAQLPHSVLLYFMYNNRLPERKKAYLYANIIKNKSKNASMYRTYHPQMERFCIKQMKAHNISANLEILYEDLLQMPEILNEVQEDLTYLLFRYEVTCENPNIKGLYIVHKELEGELYVPLSEQKAQVCLYTENAQIILVDKKENRYVKTIPYTIDKLLKQDWYPVILSEECAQNPFFLLALAEKTETYQKQDANFVQVRKQVLENPKLKQYYKQRIMMSLIQYYYAVNEEKELEYYLKKINLSGICRSERSELIEYMITKNLYTKAKEELEKFGTEYVSPKKVLRLCVNLIRDIEGNSDNLLLSFCYYVFQSGKQEESILNYLIRYFTGTTKEMYELWKAAVDFELDAKELEERLIGQILFTEDTVSDTINVFLSYYKHSTNRQLVRAFLSYYGYRYLIHGRVIPQELFAIMRKELNYQENEICLIALLNYYSTMEELNKDDLEFCELHVTDLINRNLIFPFIKNYKSKFSLPRYILDKCYVEYIADPAKQVLIHYRLETAEGEEEFIAEIMKDLYLGMRIKEFVVFYNEEVQYYITEEGSKEKITESFNMKPEDTLEEEENQYALLNMMLKAREVKDDATLLQLMEQYIKTEFVIRELYDIL